LSAPRGGDIGEAGTVRQDAGAPGWMDLLAPAWMPAVAVLVGGVLLHSMNVLLTATVLPSIVAELGGAALMSWPTTAYLASSILAAACTGLLTVVLGAGRAFCAGAIIFCAGTLLCAFAPSMAQVIAGRFVQGFGGGLLSGLAYVLIRQVFPATLWSRAFGLISSVWGISVLIGPLIGGMFAAYGHWRDAFHAVAALAALLALLAPWALPRAAGPRGDTLPRVPALRVALICLAIGAMSSAAAADDAIAKATLIAAAIGLLGLALRLDGRAGTRLLPSDAFSPRTVTGIGLWMVLWLSIAYSPMSIYGPLFLQHLHGLSPLGAGYTVAASSLGWTIASILVAPMPGAWPARMIAAGPLSTGAGLLGVGLLMPSGPASAVLVPIALIGTGAGLCWGFLAQRVMTGARPGEEDTAAAAVATVQQVGMAIGAAAAGLVANVIGISGGLDRDALLSAALWVPASFVSAAALAYLLALRLNTLASR